MPEVRVLDGVAVFLLGARPDELEPQTPGERFKDAGGGQCHVVAALPQSQGQADVGVNVAGAAQAKHENLHLSMIVADVRPWVDVGSNVFVQ